MQNKSINSDPPNHSDKLIPRGYPPKLYRVRHSTAHIMAQAVSERFAKEGHVKFAGGPPIETGFYYDFELPRAPNEEDLSWIENRMKEIIRSNHGFSMREISADEAQSIFHNQPYKLELINGLIAGQTDEDGNPIDGANQTAITIYSHDTFTDLCRGPHVANTAEISPDAVKILSIAGAYWRGDEKRPMLQRIYGTAFETAEELERFIWQREEAERRDHRRLGKDLDLFHFDQAAPGMPYWLPKGQRILNELINFWRDEHDQRGYQEISTPLINEKRLWEISGHWEHYKENMFIIPGENVTYGIKPMNCPNAMVVFNLKVRSYRDLPLRLSDCDLLHRQERSGTLHGLLRVQKFQQDDAHIFIQPDQIEEEYDRIFEITDLFYKVFGLNYVFRLGTRPEKFIGDPDTWTQAEAALKRILDRRVGPGKYIVSDGDGAFYGPKIDILMQDAIGRQWQTGTIQLDFQLPSRFDCHYVDRDGSYKTPVVIHRVIYGSLERFVGILIEHTAGVFPAWLAPVQVKIIPVIAEKHLEYSQQVATQLRKERLRVEVDDSGDRMNGKIRSAQVEKIPYMLVIGDREIEQNMVSVRLRNQENLGSMPLQDFLHLAKEAIIKKIP